LAGGDQHAQHQEHTDLRQPGQAVEHMQNAMARTDRLVAQQQAAQVDCQNATAANRVGYGENNQATADHQQGVEAVGQLHAVDQVEQQPAAAQAEQRADAELQQQLQQQIPAKPLLIAAENGDQGYGEKHCH